MCFAKQVRVFNLQGFYTSATSIRTCQGKLRMLTLCADDHRIDFPVENFVYPPDELLTFALLMMRRTIVTLILLLGIWMKRQSVKY